MNEFLLNEDKRNVMRYENFQKKYGQYGIFELPDGIVCRHHEAEWICQLLAGFKALRYEHLSLRTMNGNTSNGFYYIGNKLQTLKDYGKI